MRNRLLGFGEATRNGFARRTERNDLNTFGRAAAAAEVDAARAEAMGDVEAAVGEVVRSAASMALQSDGSSAVSDDVVRGAVRSAMGAEVSS